jgi:hypothetical protein
MVGMMIRYEFDSACEHRTQVKYICVKHFYGKWQKNICKDLKTECTD